MRLTRQGVWGPTRRSIRTVSGATSALPNWPSTFIDTANSYGPPYFAEGEHPGALHPPTDGVVIANQGRVVAPPDPTCGSVGHSPRLPTSKRARASPAPASAVETIRPFSAAPQVDDKFPLEIPDRELVKLQEEGRSAHKTSCSDINVDRAARRPKKKSRIFVLGQTLTTLPRRFRRSAP